MSTGGRKTQLPLIHEISVQLGPNSPVSGVAGVLPAGAVLSDTWLITSQAWNSTTNTVALGTTPGGAQLWPATDQTVAVRNGGFVGAAVAGPYGVDTPIYWTLARTGAAPTQGLTTFWLSYLPGPG